LTKYKFKQNHNKKLIYKLAKEFDADLHNIEKLVSTWILEQNGKQIGIIGVCKWDKASYGIVDLFVCDITLKSKEKDTTMDSLVKYLLEVAKKDNINRIYTHMGDNKINYFLNKGFIKIKETEVPKDYSCACTVCPHFEKDCFPKPIKWVNSLIINEQ